MSVTISESNFLFVEALNLHRAMRLELKQFLVKLDMPELAQAGLRAMEQVGVLHINFYRTFEKFSADPDLLNTLEEFFEEYERVTEMLTALDSLVKRAK
jgi:hypothetical protein